MIEALLSVLHHLLVAPESLQSVGTFLVEFVALVIIPGVPVTWTSAALYKSFSRGHLGAPTTVQLAWAWGSVCLMCLLVIHCLTLTLMNKMPDWTAASPEIGVVIVAGLLALGIWRAMRRDLKGNQAVLFAARTK
jgi:hypothetical protein